MKLFNEMNRSRFGRGDEGLSFDLSYENGKDDKSNVTGLVIN